VGPCRALYPHERALVQKHADKPFAFISVASDNDRDALKEHMQSENLVWPCVWDGKGTGGPISEAWGIQAWPTFYAVDRHGVIRYKSIDAPEGLLAEWASALLAEATP
jgi:predicted alpha/beta hydrolase family esterase